MNLRWTDAGRAALADAANVGTAALRLTHFAIGDGQGPGGAADDSRAALRSERHRAAVAGTPATAGRIAFRADFMPDASYGITEAGVFGVAGDPAGPLTLYLYWSDGGTEAGRAADGVTLATASVIEFQAAAADVAVTVSPAIEFGDPPDEATESEFGLTRYADATEAGDATESARAVTPQRMHGVAGKVLGGLVAGGPGDGTVYELQGTAGGRLAVIERTQDAATMQAIQSANTAIMNNAAAIQALQGKTGNASTSQKGIVELATQAELEDGTAGVLVPDAETLHDALPKLVASLKDTAPAAGERLILEGVAGGGVKIVASPFEMAYDADGHSFASGDDPEGTAVDIDGQTEWVIGEACSAVISITGRLDNDLDAFGFRLQRKPSGGGWANLAGQFRSESVGDGQIILTGAAWAGNLAAGDSIRATWAYIQGSAGTRTGPLPGDVTITRIALCLACIS